MRRLLTERTPRQDLQRWSFHICQTKGEQPREEGGWTLTGRPQSQTMASARSDSQGSGLFSKRSEVPHLNLNAAPSHARGPPATNERVLDVLRQAQDEVERKVSAELQRCSAAQQSTRRELEEARARATDLQRDLDKMTTQKNYVADAFEASRKESAKLRTENQLANEELVRLRRAVEELQIEKLAVNVGRKAVDADLSALEVERDVISRALGAATKQLYAKQQQQQQKAEAEGARARAGSAKKARPPSGKPMGSPKMGSSPASSHASTPQPTGVGRSGGRGLPW